MPSIKTSLLVALVTIAGTVSIHATIPTAERDALIELYEATGGDGWTDNTGWLGAAGTECTWYSITCDDEGTTVVDIGLWSNGLTGTIPSSIGNFPNLTGLALAENDLGGSIPVSIGNLTSLTTLNLQVNRLTGPIPSSVGNLSSLVEMHLYENQLSGPIPASLGQLSALQMLTLASNELTGALPPELGNLSSLQYLDLGGLNLTGSIPSTLGQLSNLEYLSLESSQLTGSIPPELGQLFNLKHLDLQYNRLSGTIPAALGNLSSIEELLLGGNRDYETGEGGLTGGIPGNLMNLTTLVTLTIDSNRLTGSIPGSIGNLSNLEYLSLGFNELSGNLPKELGQLQHLMYLDMPGNRFSGQIPEELGDAPSLSYIDLSGNQDNDTGLGGLTGPVPVSLSKAGNLQTLELSNNDLSGTIPSELGMLSNLEWLGLAENRISGTVPDSFANLSKLRWLSLFGNRLEGTIPSWLGELTDLTGILLGGNRLTGTIPANITDLSELQSFDICGNFISGPIPTDIDRLANLEYLTLCENDLSGPIPDGFWTLEKLIEIRLEDNQLSGTLPASVRNLTNADVLLLGMNQLSGSIPPEIGELSTVTVLTLGSNRFTGTIPPEIGNLTQLLYLDLAENALRGEIPEGMMNLVNLETGGLRLGFNALFTTDPALRNFINSVHEEPFENYQTVPPTGVTVAEVTDRSAIVSWSPILYWYDEGGFEVTAVPASGGVPIVATTSSKEITSIILRGLSAETSYQVMVRTATHPHGSQQNFIRSDSTPPVSFTTGPRVTAPPLIGVVSLPGGLIQIGGEPQNTTSYTLANFGDIGTDIALEQYGDFFTQSPTSFSLEAGEQRIITVSSVPNQPAGSYWAEAQPVGNGVPEDLFITIQLLSVEVPSGQAIAEAVTSRVELSGAINEDEIGTVTFRNVGTATLTGILVSDVDWIETSTDVIEIPAGEVRNINFTVRRSKRPDAALGGGGALFATIRLVYISGTSSASFAGVTPFNGTTGVTQTLVTVVDTSKTPVTLAEIPPLQAGEVMQVIPGVVSGDTTLSDVFITNSFGSRDLTDLRVYFRPSGETASYLADPGDLRPTQSLAFASVLDSVFESNSSTGSLFIRTDQIENVLATATTTSTSGQRSFADSIPIFRSDRAIRAGEALYLPGIRVDDSHATTLYIQEVSGENATATVEVVDPSGAPIEVIPVDSIEPFGLVELAAPGNGMATVVVTSGPESPGRIVAWASVEDLVSGDIKAVVDWSRFHSIEEDTPLRIPYVIRAGERPVRQRPVRRPQGIDAGTAIADELSGGGLSTSVNIFNPGTVSATIRLTYWTEGMSNEKTLSIAGRHTLTSDDVVTFVRGGSGSSIGYLVVTPLRGHVSVSARVVSQDPSGGTAGTSVPVLAATSGLRLGQPRLFAGLEDATRATVLAELGGTTRTTIGIVEFAGDPVTVRATLRGIGGRLVVGAIERDFSVRANSAILIEDMARAILGPQRDNLLGDLRNLQLELRVVDGEGAVTVFVLSTDNGSNDPVLRLQ